MWYAAGNPSSWEMAARKGLGILGFSIGDLSEIEPVISAYRSAIPHAEPVGGFVNDNVMVTLAAYVAPDSAAARRSWVAARPSYLVSNVFRYHDTFPRPPHVPRWPERIPDVTEADAAMYIASAATIIGTPDEALVQLRRWESTGVDQLVFGIGPAAQEDTLTTIRLLGEHVIPKLDTDPMHRTTRLRRTASQA